MTDLDQWQKEMKVMKKLRNKRVQKLTVKDLKKALKKVDDDKEVVLGFYMKDGGTYYCYLAEVLTNLKYDSVVGEKLSSSEVVELIGYSDDFCTYIERNENDIK